MIKLQLNNSYDVFNSYLVENADYSGFIELPLFKTSDKLPEKIISFSKAKSASCKDFDSWIIFYEYDDKFERLWNSPKKYLERIKKFSGVISPDFSLYRNMPLIMQMWNTYQGRMLAHWLSKNGIEVIPNIRWGETNVHTIFALTALKKILSLQSALMDVSRQKRTRTISKKDLPR